jgi:hypothetical protein
VDYINAHLITVPKIMSNEIMAAGPDTNVRYLHHQCEHKAQPPGTREQDFMGHFLQGYHRFLQMYHQTPSSVHLKELYLRNLLSFQGKLPKYLVILVNKTKYCDAIFSLLKK